MWGYDLSLVWRLIGMLVVRLLWMVTAIVGVRVVNTRRELNYIRRLRPAPAVVRQRSSGKSGEHHFYRTVERPW